MHNGEIPKEVAKKIPQYSTKFALLTLLNRKVDFCTIRDFPTRRATTPGDEKMII